MRTPTPLHALPRSAIDVELRSSRWPKWQTLCLLRAVGLPTLDTLLIPPSTPQPTVRHAIDAFAERLGSDHLMLRSDGGRETRPYYRGGNSHPHDGLVSRALRLMESGRAVLLMEPTDRFTNRLTVMMRLDRPRQGQPGTLTLDVLGPGYDVADLTRGGNTPQVTLTLFSVSWDRYHPPWRNEWQITTDLTPSAEGRRRTRRLRLLAPHVLTDTDQGQADHPETLQRVTDWLTHRGAVQLFGDYDPTPAVLRRTRELFDDAYLLGRAHPNRDWRCLATAFSVLGNRRCVYWDVVDAARKYATADRPLVLRSA